MYVMYFNVFIKIIENYEDKGFEEVVNEFVKVFDLVVSEYV